MRGIFTNFRLAVIASVAMAVALVGSACTTRASGEEVSASPESTAYLAFVGATEKDFARAFIDIAEIVTASYQARQILLDAIRDADLPGVATLAMSQADALTPPSHLVDDHDLWIKYRTEVDRLANVDLPLALERENLQELIGVTTEIEQSLGVLLSQSSGAFCRAASFDPVLCRAGQDLPGGDYGRDVHEALRQHRLETFGLFTFIADMTDDELMTRLSSVQPLIEHSLRSTGDQLKNIEPPADFAADHAAMVRFFDEQYVVALAITEAIAAQDTEGVLLLFSESERVENRVMDAISAAFSKIAAPFVARSLTN